jgi:hypothetical protein
MFKSSNWRLILGGLLVVVGILALLDTLTVFPFTGILWGLIFASAGAGFLVYMMGERSAWWAVIPGVILLGLGTIIGLTSLFPGWGDRISGPIFLSGISLAFWLVYVRNRNFWWAIIPGGVMGSLAVTAFMDEFTRFDGGFFFLFGLALTFALIALLPGLPGNRQWPWIPASILFVISVLALFSSLNWMSFFWAFLLIGAGAFLLLRSVFQRKVS